MNGGRKQEAEDNDRASSKGLFVIPLSLRAAVRTLSAVLRVALSRMAPLNRPQPGRQGFEVWV